jgi:hypothetical protein
MCLSKRSVCWVVALLSRRQFQFLFFQGLLIVIRGRQGSSEVVRGRQRSSEVVRGRQRSSEVVRGRQGSSGVFRGRQRSSGVVRGLQRSPRTKIETAFWKGVQLPSIQSILRHSLALSATQH